MIARANLQAKEDTLFLKGNSRILLSGKAFIADLTGALYWPAEEMLIVSDLNLKREADEFPSDQFVQSRNSSATLLRLSQLISNYKVSQLIVLGNSLASSHMNEQPLNDYNIARLRDMQNMCKWIWVMENNTAPEFLKRFGVKHQESFTLGGLTFRHKPIQAPVINEVAGFFAPIAKTNQNGRLCYQRCFASNAHRLLLPSFDPKNEGINILDKEISPIFSSSNLYIWLVGMTSVYAYTSRLLLED